MGRPSAFDPELLDKAEQMYSEGATDHEVAVLFSVTSTTIDNWKKSKPEFLAILKKGKALADDLVEKSLYQLAISGNVTAQIFWLKNRRPVVWRDKQEIEHSSSPSPFELFISTGRQAEQSEEEESDGN